MKVRDLLFWTVIVALTTWGCSGNDEGNNEEQNPPQSDDASGSVRSDSNGLIETPDGARIVIPRGAVPRAETGEQGTMVFSVEQTEAPQIVNLPSHLTVIESAYRFGPGGFVFALPVEVSLPVSGDYMIGEILLGRVNPTTSEFEVFSAEYDPDSNRISALTYEMSVWVIVRNAIDAELRAYSWIAARNNLSDAYAVICVESFEPTFPEDANFAGQRTVISPANWYDFGIHGDNWVRWSLPQGVYSFCLEFVPLEATVPRRSVVVAQIPLNDPDGWVLTFDWLSFTNSDWFEITDEHYNSATPNTVCGCNPAATPSVGTGEVQVTLTWHNELPLDLDLWVTDPNGERCYYGNTPSSSGGVLDRDNLCSNYANGRPENIYWTDAPAGTYRIDVDWYSACGNSIASQDVSVRIVGGNETETVDGTLVEGETLNIADFEFSGGALSIQPKHVASAMANFLKPSKTGIESRSYRQ